MSAEEYEEGRETGERDGAWYGSCMHLLATADRLFKDPRRATLVSIRQGHRGMVCVIRPTVAGMFGTEAPSRGRPASQGAGGSQSCI